MKSTETSGNKLSLKRNYTYRCRNDVENAGTRQTGNMQKLDYRTISRGVER